MRHVSGIVKPDNPELVSFIRSHARFKGYIEPGGPPGYLLIRANTDFGNFLARCREYGFDIEVLG